MKLAFMLPHAVVGHLHRLDPTVADRLRPSADHCPELWAHLCTVAAELGQPAEHFVPLGLHGDGVPFNALRTRSLEVFSMNFPAAVGPAKAVRVPLTAVPKHMLAKGDDGTFQAICSILLWSFRHLALGIWPRRQHDGSPWPEGSPFSRLGGQALGFAGLLAEIRADWAWVKETLRLPGWREKTGCCWLCKATPVTMLEVSAEASWRHEELTAEERLARVRARGVTPCPLFSAPGVSPAVVLPDWLRCMDLGVAADILGNVFWMCLPRLPGTRKQRVTRLFQRIRDFYQAGHVAHKLGALTEKMIKMPDKPPKLRGKAAEVRAVVPFGKQFAGELLAGGDAQEEAARALARQLANLYLLLEARDPERMAAASRKVAALYVELAARAEPPCWRVKPKLHLMQELCERTVHLRGCPRDFWTYRDEDFGGAVAKSARRRGGRWSSLAVSSRVLQRFMCRHALQL